MGLGLSMADVESGPDGGTLCDSVSYMERGASSKVTVTCITPTQGNTVLLTMEGPYDTALSACEVFVSIIEG